VAGDEDQTKEVVFDVVGFGDVEISHGGILLRFEFPAQLFVFAFEELVAAEVIDGAMLSSGHQPSAGIVGDARVWPFFQRGHQCILREFFGHAYVANDASQARDQARGFNTPDGVDRSVNVFGRHGGPLRYARSVFGKRPPARSKRSPVRIFRRSVMPLNC
jgi:hypothetical protein